MDNHCKIFECTDLKFTVSGRSIDRHTLRNVVTLVWGSLRLTPINRASCYMPAHTALLSKCEVLIERSFTIAGGLNGHAKQTLKCFNCYQYSIFSTGWRFCLFQETL